MAEKKIQSFQDLPDWVKDQVLDKKTVEKNKKIVKDFNLSEKQKSIFFAGLRKVILKQITPYKILDFLKNIDISENNKKKLALRIIQDRLLPLQEFFKQDIREVYKKIGGKLNKKKQEEYKPKEEKKLDKIVDKIIEIQGLKFDTEKMRQRFEDILTLYLKGVQSKVETRILLKRGQNIGGLGLDDDVIDKIFELSQEKNILSKKAESKQKKTSSKKIEKTPHQDLKDKKEDINKKEDARKKKDVGQKEEIKYKDKKAKEDRIFQKNKNTQPKRDLQKSDNKEKKEFPDDITEQERIVKQAINLNQKNIKDLEKEKAEKQKKSKKEKSKVNIFSRSHGPIDELRILTLEDFRRWGGPKQATQSIKDKIDLLGEESLEKKSKAIQAWKESKIYKLYLKIGEESINQGKSISKIIKKRKENNKPTLTEQEFNAVLSLNEDLRF